MTLRVVTDSCEYYIKKTNESIDSLATATLKDIVRNSVVVKSNESLYELMRDYAAGALFENVKTDLQEYFEENDEINLTGFVRFRGNIYAERIDKFFSNLVNRLVIKNHYEEFISGMKKYVSQNKVSPQKIYLSCVNGTYDLYDENYRPLTEEAGLYYLRDFGVSAELRTDCILHYLLNTIPKEICLNVLDIENHNFLKTVQLVFGERVKVKEQLK